MLISSLCTFYIYINDTYSPTRVKNTNTIMCVRTMFFCFLIIPNFCSIKISTIAMMLLLDHYVTIKRSFGIDKAQSNYSRLYKNMI